MAHDPSTLEAFRARVAEDSDLQEQVSACRDAASVVALGQREGFEFTAASVETLLNDGELSDFELELVAGGGSFYAKDP